MLRMCTRFREKLAPPQPPSADPEVRVVSAGAMGIAATATVAVLLAVEPLDTGLQGVWQSLAFLSMMRLSTLLWRYQISANGPLPKLGAATDAAQADAQRQAAQGGDDGAASMPVLPRRGRELADARRQANNIVPQQRRQRHRNEAQAGESNDRQ